MDKTENYGTLRVGKHLFKVEPGYSEYHEIKWNKKRTFEKGTTHTFSNGVKQILFELYTEARSECGKYSVGSCTRILFSSRGHMQTMYYTCECLDTEHYLFTPFPETDSCFGSVPDLLPSEWIQIFKAASSEFGGDWKM